MGKKKKLMPVKRTMNLYFKTDRSEKPATIALYVLLGLVVTLGLAKLLVYDVWVEVEEARAAWAAAQSRLDEALLSLQDYDEIRQRYQRLAATEEETEQIDRMEIVALVDEKVGRLSNVRNYAVSGKAVQIQIDQLTLEDVAEIVRRLEESPIVVHTTVHTASTTGADNTVEELVSASILIELQKEVSQDEKTAVGS